MDCTRRASTSVTKRLSGWCRRYLKQRAFNLSLSVHAEHAVVRFRDSMRIERLATTQAVVEAGAVPPLVQMLQLDDSLAVTGAAAACCNLAGSSPAVQVLPRGSCLLIFRAPHSRRAGQLRPTKRQHGDNLSQPVAQQHEWPQCGAPQLSVPFR